MSTAWHITETGKADHTLRKEALFSDLYHECKLAQPGIFCFTLKQYMYVIIILYFTGARLTYGLRIKLEKTLQSERKEIACRMKEGCAPLFIACKKGNVEIVEYLITHCDADVEQRGKYEVPDDRSVHNVTPLWCGECMIFINLH